MKEEIFEYEEGRLKISILCREQFWDISEGDLIYRDNGKVNELLNKDITDEVYSDLLSNIKNEFRVFIDGDIPLDLGELEESILNNFENPIEGYETLKDFNIELEVMD